MCWPASCQAFGLCAGGGKRLNRLEHRPRREAGKYHKIDYRAPKEIVLDLDATDDTIHGEQEGRFFHGY